MIHKIKQPQLNLRKVMMKKNVNDEWLADKIQISRTSVNRMINGHTMPSLQRLYDCAEALEVSLFDLFD
ncbi:MAG: helix-turn-helix transcriptional regulator [Prevotella sp.]|nr:helix-turn-helix transcriptional regulator [Prevotella sp.]